LSTNDPVKIDDIMSMHYPNSRVKFDEARELSWRKFYSEAGGREKLIALDGSSIIGKLLKKCEKCFLDILENKLSDEEILEFIKLPSTETWIEDYQDVPIVLKEKIIDQPVEYTHTEKENPIKSINCKVVITSKKNTGNVKKNSGNDN
jgi:hypothetical protein